MRHRRLYRSLYDIRTIVVVVFIVAAAIGYIRPAPPRAIAYAEPSWVSQTGAGYVGPACASSTNYPEIEAGNCTYIPPRTINQFGQPAGLGAHPDGGSDAGVTITQGQSTNLCWACEYINDGWSATGNNFSTGGAEGGQIQVSPSVTTSYSIFCSKLRHTSNTVTVIVNPAPSCTSSPNVCGMTNQGQIINGVCNAATPSNSQCGTCTASNSCGQSNSGYIVNGSCNVSAPSNGQCACGTSLSGGSCGFVASPSTVLTGGQVTLQWYCPSSLYTSSQGDSNFSTGGSLSGSVQVAPGVSTTYTLQCVNAQGSSTGTQAVTVNQPNLSLATSPATRVVSGDPLTVTWSATNVNANSCAVTSNTSPIDWTGNSGSQQTSITAQTTFTLTCSDPRGPINTSVTVNLVPQFIEQ